MMPRVTATTTAWPMRRAVLMAGVLLVYGFPGFSSVAMQTVPASHGGVVLGVLQLMTATFAALLYLSVGSMFAGFIFWNWGMAIGTCRCRSPPCPSGCSSCSRSPGRWWQRLA